MAMGSGREKGALVAEINVTPMADVMIVLLIIFMVTVPLIGQDGVKLPAAANAEEKKGKELVVVLRADLTLFLGGERLDTMGELLPKVQQRLAERPEGPRVVSLKADLAVPSGEVMKVVELCREAGAEEVALVAERPPQG